MSKHTQGPWNSKYGNYVYKGEPQDPSRRLLAVCEPTTRIREDWDETFANARLISAAPELYDIVFRLYTQTWHKKVSVELCEKMLAVIRKVQGP